MSATPGIFPKYPADDVEAGDILIGGAGGADFDLVAIGADGTMLKSNGGTPEWVAGATYLEGLSNFRLPRYHIDGLKLRWSSATAIIVEAGSCRDRDDAGNITLSGEVTVPITTVAAFTATHGLDETTLVGTATTHGSATFEPSASLYAEAAMTRIVRSGTGTITGAGTTITGTSTKFLTELAVGDVIRSSAVGATRILTIVSDTSLTVVAAFPGGSPGGAAFTIYENLTIWPDTAQSGDKRLVNTISANGLSVIVPSVLTSSRAGAPMKIGVEIISIWLFVWVVTNGTDTICILSTQRTTPILASVTTKRLLGAAYNDSSGNLLGFTMVVAGRLARLSYQAPTFYGMLSGGAATSYTRTIWGTYAPAIATAILAQELLLVASTETNDDLQDLDISIDGTNRYLAGSALVDNGEHRGALFQVVWLPRGGTDGRDQATYYKVTDGTTNTAFLAVVAWEFER